MEIFKRECIDFSITQILREINFDDSGSAKSAILTHLEALNFDFNVFLHFLKAEIYLKMAVLVLLHSLKLISRKIWICRKVPKFPHCVSVKVSYFQKSNFLLWFRPHLNFPPQSRHEFSWKWQVSKFPKSKMLEFQQFQTGKTSILAKFDKPKHQFQWKIACLFSGKIQMWLKPVPKKLTFSKNTPLPVRRHKTLSTIWSTHLTSFKQLVSFFLPSMWRIF